MIKILIIGGVAIDTIVRNGKRCEVAGGAGVYTSLAAAACGAEVSLLALRPEPLPLVLMSFAGRLSSWQGPPIPAGELSHFEIGLDADLPSFRVVNMGPEERLTMDMLPDDIQRFDCVHVTPVSCAARQLEFLRALKRQGAKKISAGTFIHEVKNHPNKMLEAISLVDYFFMNEYEATTLFGSLERAHTHKGGNLFVTLGGEGVMIIQDEKQFRLSGEQVEEVDPTGAGDVFCGSVLAHMAAGFSIQQAAREGMKMAADKVQRINSVDHLK